MTPNRLTCVIWHCGSSVSESSVIVATTDRMSHVQYKERMNIRVHTGYSNIQNNIWYGKHTAGKYSIADAIKRFVELCDVAEIDVLCVSGCYYGGWEIDKALSACANISVRELCVPDVGAQQFYVGQNALRQHVAPQLPVLTMYIYAHNCANIITMVNSIAASTIYLIFFAKCSACALLLGSHNNQHASVIYLASDGKIQRHRGSTTTQQNYAKLSLATMCSVFVLQLL